MGGKHRTKTTVNHGRSVGTNMIQMLHTKSMSCKIVIVLRTAINKQSVLIQQQYVLKEC